MISETPKEIMKKRYGVWGGNPKGRAYDPERCAGKVHDGYLTHQCRRKKGHGPYGLYCKQHAKIYVMAEVENIAEVG